MEACGILLVLFYEQQHIHRSISDNNDNLNRKKIMRWFSVKWFNVCVYVSVCLCT